MAGTIAEQASDDLTQEIMTHVTALRRYALVLVADPHEADDLVQECLSRVLAQMRSWRPVRDLRAYLGSFWVVKPKAASIEDLIVNLSRAA